MTTKNKENHHSASKTATSLIGYRKSQKIKGAFISHPSPIDWDEMISVQRDFANFIDSKSGEFDLATLFDISPNRTVFGIPFTWGISIDGGHFTFYMFGEVPKKDFLKAKRKLKNSQDVVSIKTERIELVNDWKPPTEYVELTTLPQWINRYDMNYIDGMEL